VPYFIRDGRIQTEGIQFAAADHCNLRCADCLTLSPYAPPKLSSSDTIAADLRCLETVLHAREMRILGGEPLLNPELAQLTSIARESGIGDEVTMFSNGLLLGRMDEAVWPNLDLLNLSIYPEAPPPAAALDRALELAQQHGTRVRFFRRHEFRTRVVSTPHRIDLATRLIYRTCRAAHYDHCHWVSEGWLYKCATPLFLNGYLAKLGRDGYEPAKDGVQLHEGPGLFDDVKRYLTSSEPLDCCRYCLGNLGVSQPHRQLSKDEVAAPDARTSRATHLNRMGLALHLAKYARRAMISRLRGGLD
jgi:hypothetical protein